MARQHRHFCQIALLLLLASCGSTIEPASSTAHKARGSGTPIVFVPGIKGSALADSEGDTAFLTRAEALGFATPSLALPLRFIGDRQASDGRSAPGILRELFLVPKLIGERIYGPWLDALRASGRPVYLFAYDWRRDNLETLDTLSRFVNEVRRLHDTPVQLIGHSMGGMLSIALIARGSQDVASLTTVGSPLQGGVGFLPDLHTGASIGRNGKLLAPEVLATFPSVYGFFSSTPGDGTDDPTLDWFDPEAWHSHHLGPYADGRTMPDGFDAFFATALAHAHDFRRLVDSEPELFIPLTVVAGDGVATLDTVRHSSTGWSFDTPRVPGDGRVPAERARPAHLQHRLITSKAEHSALLNDPIVIQALLAGDERPKP